eukprot:jgi/Tetstr1/449926/TSEL_036980.t1
MADDNDFSLKITVIWDGRLLAKSMMIDFERGWLETHTLRDLLEFAVGEVDNKLVLRADAKISANCVQHVDVMTASGGKRRQPQDKYISRRLEKKVWEAVMLDVPTDKIQTYIICRCLTL